MAEPTITYTVLRICSIFIRQSPKRLCAYSVSKEMAVSYNVAWEALRRLEDAGWFHGEMERVNPSLVPRPRRRLYKMTEQGRARAVAVLVDLQLPDPVVPNRAAV